MRNALFLCISLGALLGARADHIQIQSFAGSTCSGTPFETDSQVRVFQEARARFAREAARGSPRNRPDRRLPSCRS